MSAPPPHAVYVKRYRRGVDLDRSVANYRWLTSLDGPLRLPRLLAVGARELEFEFVAGRPGTPADLRSLAAHLGDVHGAAYVTELHRARLDAPYLTSDGHRIPDFVTPRLGVIHERLICGRVPEPGFGPGGATRLLARSVHGPAAFYKDANPRNFILTTDLTADPTRNPTGEHTDRQPVTVDADDLTLAPFGYDLAKLIVTLAMTHGSIHPSAISEALTAYNSAAHQHDRRLGEVSGEDLTGWMEIHHILTSPYLGRGGYRYGWHTVRPPVAGSRRREGAQRWP